MSELYRLIQEAQTKGEDGKAVIEPTETPFGKAFDAWAQSPACKDPDVSMYWNRAHTALQSKNAILEGISVAAESESIEELQATVQQYIGNVRNRVGIEKLREEAKAFPAIAQEHRKFAEELDLGDDFVEETTLKLTKRDAAGLVSQLAFAAKGYNSTAHQSLEERLRIIGTISKKAAEIVPPAVLKANRTK